MARFHINKHGVPAPCRAKAGNCPLGGNETHFDSMAEAQEFIDIRNEEEFGLLNIANSRHEVDRFDRLNKVSSILGEDKVIEELYSSLPSDKVKAIKDTIVYDYDLDDYIDEDYGTHEQFNQVKRFLGVETTLNEMSVHLSAQELHESLDYIEDKFDISTEKDIDDIDEKFANLISDTNKQVNKLIDDVENWLDETEDLIE